MKRIHKQFGTNPHMSICQTGPLNFSTRRPPITTTDNSKVTCKACLKVMQTWTPPNPDPDGNETAEAKADTIARLKHFGVLVAAFVVLTGAAFAQSINCTHLDTLHKTVCATQVGERTVYSYGELTAGRADAGVISYDEYTAAISAETAALEAQSALMQKDTAIRNAGRYGQKKWDCEAAGGKWSNVRHSCKGGR